MFLSLGRHKVKKIANRRVKVKVKVTLEQTTRAQRESKYIDLLFL
jgi:hypothetical protein